MVETILKGSETMNKGIALVLTLLLVLSLLPAASANSWGLKGKLLTLVMDDARWDNYSTVCNQAGSWAILGSRYHNALFHAAEDGLGPFNVPGGRHGAGAVDLLGGDGRNQQGCYEDGERFLHGFQSITNSN